MYAEVLRSSATLLLLALLLGELQALLDVLLFVQKFSAFRFSSRRKHLRHVDVHGFVNGWVSGLVFEEVSRGRAANAR